MINTEILMVEDARRKDPDSYSYRLATYHQFLWSKSQPNGSYFSLAIIGTSKFYLKTTINNEVFECSSDRIVMTMLKWKRMTNILHNFQDRTLKNVFSYIDSAITHGTN